MGQDNSNNPQMADRAIVPINTISEEDLKAGGNRFDKWLKEISGGWLTLDRLLMVAGSMPVLGNIIAAIDTVLDIVAMMKKQVVEFMDWLGLGINILGILPIPPGTAAFRMGVRPVLHAVRGALARGAKDLPLALVTVIADDIWERYAGSIEKFVEQGKAKVSGMVTGIANKADELIKGLLAAFETAIKGQFFDVEASKKNLSETINTSRSRRWYDPKRSFDGWVMLYHAVAGGTKSAANWGAREVMPEKVKQKLLQTVNLLKKHAPVVKQKILALNSAEKGGLLWLFVVLGNSVRLWRKKGHGRNTVGMSTNKPAQSQHNRTSNKIESTSAQKPAHRQPNGCKNSPARVGTRKSVDFATGGETFTHIDFELPGVMPLTWARTYSSRMASFDQGVLGARWLTSYTLCILIEEHGGWTYYGNDGRDIKLNVLNIGEAYRHPIEGFTLLRVNESLITLTHGKEQIEVYELYGKQFRLALLKDRIGNALTLHYEEDRLKLITDTQGQHIYFTHDEHGRFARVELYKEGAAPRLLAQYTYDEYGDLRQATNEAGDSWNYTYRNHLITRYTDRTGRGNNLEWDGDDAKAKCIHEFADDGSLDTQLAWNPNIRQTVVRNALGHATSYFYDIDGYTYRIIYPDNTEEWFFRDERKNVVKHVHPDGSKDVYAYDERDNMIEHIARDNSIQYFAYDDDDQLITITDQEGGKWQRSYDDQGNLISETDPKNHVTRYTYNKLGLPISVIDAKGGVKALVWRADGQIQSHTDCSGKTTKWEYDAKGRVTRIQDAMGNATQYQYDKRGYLSHIITADGKEQNLEHDAEGRLLVHQNSREQQTRYHYDAAGRVIKRVDPMHRRISYTYDKVGRLTQLTDANGAHYTFSYDVADRIIEECGFDGKRTQYAYDNGVLTQVNEANTRTVLTFDLAGRLVERQSGDEKETFAYSQRGDLIKATTNHSTLQWFYDAVGNLEKEYQEYKFGDMPQTYVWRHEYDELGNRITTLRPDGQRIDYLVYGSGHVHGMMLNLQEFASFERDNLHRENKRYLLNQLEQNTQYDQVGRILQQNITGKTKQQRQYQYDDIGQLVGINDSNRGFASYQYDPVGRLLKASTPERIETFAFDPAGNILSPEPEEQKDISYKPEGATRTESYFPQVKPTAGQTNEPIHPLVGNLLRKYAGIHYDYDERGNLICKTQDGKITEFIWDNFNRLRTVKTETTTSNYYYDALGRRIAKLQEQLRPVFTVKGEFKAQQQQTLYHWDNDVLAIETTEGNSTHYVFEPNSFIPLVQFETLAVKGIDTPELPANQYRYYEPEKDPLNKLPQAPVEQPQIYFIHTDHLGTPQEMSDIQGQMVWEAQYKAWGQAQEIIAKAAQGTGISCPFRFQGQYYDEESGLHYNRYRYYDPLVGRFISNDPIKLSGGNNLYTYAPNPIEFVDPLGLKKIPAARCAQILNEINSRIKAFNDEMSAYDPVLDARGGFTHAHGTTVPGGHYIEIRQLQRGIKNRLREFNTGECPCTLSPVKYQVTIARAQAVVNKPIAIPPGSSFISISSPDS